MISLLRPLAFLLVLTSFMACTSDDTNPLDPDPDPAPEFTTLLLPKKITGINEAYTIDFHYTDSFLLDNFTLKNDTGILQEAKAIYEQERLVTLYNHAPDENSAVSFSYNEDHQIVKIESENTPTISYTYNDKKQVTQSKIDHLLLSKYTFNALGTIEKSELIVTVPGQLMTKTHTYTYDEKNHPFQNTNYNFELNVSELLNYTNLVYVPSHNITKEYTVDPATGIETLLYTYEYQYNEYDYPVRIRKNDAAGTLLEERTYEYEIHQIEIQE